MLTIRDRASAVSGAFERWALGRQAPPYGDGYVHEAFVEVSDDGISASDWASSRPEGTDTVRLPDVAGLGVVRLARNPHLGGHGTRDDAGCHP